MPLASFCWADRFEFYLVENPEDRFSRDEAEMLTQKQTMRQKKKKQKQKKTKKKKLIPTYSFLVVYIDP